MMKMILTAAMVLAFNFAQATSMHPCTPTVQAKPTHLYCADGELKYSITIETLMSRPLAMCQGENHYENQTAKIDIYEDGLVKSQVTIFNDSFSYELGANGSSFSSPVLKLKLKKCVTPMDGGFSVGN